MVKLLITMLLGFAGMYYPGKQHNINFDNKTLYKILEKYCETPVLEELSVDTILDFNDEKGKYYKISGDSESAITYAYIGRVNTCRSGGCSNSGNESENFSSEYFDYFILYNNTGSVVTIKIFDYAATKGQEVTTKRWLSQFQDYDGNEEITVGKQIDGITGATISVYSITADIEYRTKLLQKIITKLTAKL